MKESLDSIERNKKWELVDLTHGKWVFKIKWNPKGEVIKHIANLVAYGFLKREHVDFEEMFALMTRTEIIRLVVAIENNNN